MNIKEQASNKRSATMSRIRKTNTKPEIIVRKALFKNGLRFRIHDKTLPGCPGIVLKKHKTIIFVNGCFWHAHEGCKLNRMPKTRTEYWIPKIIRNAARDGISKLKLEDMGWSVLTIWECDLKKEKIDMAIKRLVDKITDAHEIY